MSREIDVKVAEAMGWTPYLHKRGEYTHVEWGKPGYNGNPWEIYKRGSVDPADWIPVKASEIDHRKHIDNYVGTTFRPSENIEDAFVVAEHARKTFHHFRLSIYADGLWVASFWETDYHESWETNVSPSLAICLAFLAAKGVSDA